MAGNSSTKFITSPTNIFTSPPQITSPSKCKHKPNVPNVFVCVSAFIMKKSDILFNNIIEHLQK